MPEKPEPAIWYAKINDVEYGPFTQRQLKQYASERRIIHDSLIRKGLSKWVLAGSINGLVPSFDETPAQPKKLDLEAIVAQVKSKSAMSKAKSGPRKTSPANWIVIGMLGTITTCIVAATLMYVVLPAFVVITVSNAVAEAQRSVREAKAQAPARQVAPRSVPLQNPANPWNYKGLASQEDTIIPETEVMESNEHFQSEPPPDPENKNFDVFRSEAETQQAKSERIPDAEYLKSTLSDASALYNACVRQYAKAVSTADKEQSLIDYSTAARQWAERLGSHCIEIKVRVNDVLRQNGRLVASVDTIPELVPYLAARRQMQIRQVHIPLPDTKEKVLPGYSLRVICDLSAIAYTVGRSDPRSAIQQVSNEANASPAFDLNFLPDTITDGQAAPGSLIPEGNWFYLQFSLRNIEVVEVLPPEK